jgi:hypothetical protein
MVFPKAATEVTNEFLTAASTRHNGLSKAEETS